MCLILYLILSLAIEPAREIDNLILSYLIQRERDSQAEPSAQVSRKEY